MGNIALEGMTAEEARNAVAGHTPRSLRLTTPTKSYTLQGTELGITADYSQTAKNAIQQGRNHTFAMFGLSETRSSKPFLPVHRYDAEAITKVVDTVAQELSTAPQNASIAVSEGTITVTPETEGNAVDTVALANILRAAHPTIFTEEMSAQVPTVPVPAKVTKADLEPVRQVLEAKLSLNIRLIVRNEDHFPSRATKMEWLTLSQPAADQPPTVRVNATAIRTYVRTLARSINRASVPHTVTLSEGRIVAESAGQNGVAVDQTKTYNAILNSFTNNEPLIYAVPLRTIRFTTVYSELSSVSYLPAPAAKKTSAPDPSIVYIIEQELPRLPRRYCPSITA